MRILIADDSLTCRMILSGALKENGYDVVETADGLEAWGELCKPDAPQIAILDWVMPKLDGLELIQKVRASRTDRPPYLIMLTGKSEKKDIIIGLNAGANDYLIKPFDPSELSARVQVGRRMIELQDALFKSKEKLAYQATHDPLTGLLNRRAILDRLSDEFTNAIRKNKMLCVGICDIDHFKHINDTYGHQTGDDILCKLSNILEQITTDSEHVGRIGGEEFLIISSTENETDFNSRFERYRRQIADTGLMTRSGALSVSVSIGVASCTGKNTVDELLAAADAALYEAKNQGRNCVQYTRLS
jgi:diguanylate cyclase (GGDEF)-like protein